MLPALAFMAGFLSFFFLQRCKRNLLTSTIDSHFSRRDASHMAQTRVINHSKLDWTVAKDLRVIWASFIHL